MCYGDVQVIEDFILAERQMLDGSCCSWCIEELMNKEGATETNDTSARLSSRVFVWQRVGSFGRPCDA